MSRVAILARTALMRKELAAALQASGHTVLGSVGTLPSFEVLLRRATPDLVVVEEDMDEPRFRLVVSKIDGLPVIRAAGPADDGPDHRSASVQAVVRAVGGGGGPRTPAEAPKQRRALGRVPHPLVVIGSSTGGPQVLETLLTGLPASTPPIVIAQHMPPTQTLRLARRLDGLSGMNVREATGGETLAVGDVWIAPGNRHLTLQRHGVRVRLSVDESPKVNGHRPSVTVLFRSLLEVGPHGALALLLTGMGSDGAEALLELKRSGAKTLTQDEASSAVFGMPRVARELGASQGEGPPEALKRHILNYHGG